MDSKGFPNTFNFLSQEIDEHFANITFVVILFLSFSIDFSWDVGWRS